MVTPVNLFLVCLFFAAPVDKLKREASSSGLTTVPPSKKLKVNLPGTRPGIPGASGSALLSLDRMGPGTTGVEPWEALATECEVNELFENVVTQITSESTDKAVSVIFV